MKYRFNRCFSKHDALNGSRSDQYLWLFDELDKFEVEFRKFKQLCEERKHFTGMYNALTLKFFDVIGCFARFKLPLTALKKGILTNWCCVVTQVLAADVFHHLYVEWAEKQLSCGRTVVSEEDLLSVTLLIHQTICGTIRSTSLRLRKRVKYGRVFPEVGQEHFEFGSSKGVNCYSPSEREASRPGEFVLVQVWNGKIMN